MRSLGYGVGGGDKIQAAPRQVTQKVLQKYSRSLVLGSKYFCSLSVPPGVVFRWGWAWWESPPPASSRGPRTQGPKAGAVGRLVSRAAEPRVGGQDCGNCPQPFWNQNTGKCQDVRSLFY